MMWKTFFAMLGRKALQAAVMVVVEETVRRGVDASGIGAKPQLAESAKSNKKEK